MRDLSNRLPFEDRRRFQRLSVNITVFFQIEEPGDLRQTIGSQEIEATTVNISEGGMAFITRHNLPAWTKLAVKFYLFKSGMSRGILRFMKPVRIAAEVRTNLALEMNEYRVGVSFKDVSPVDQERLSAFFRSVSCN
ncbi:MAG TPA: PilZ domain-containing protein [Candidatus Omnitrophota bacterium]|nr:PilZ domain-containing protein [Candidatus Omnitrophota bacterium]HPT07028.1 PilZ domain-containing protein [Candidatus Omnitrophota bacterium]